jgi:hypothetical protein
VRAGDAYVLDYNLVSFSAMMPYAARLNLVVICNGTDFHWEGII